MPVDPIDHRIAALAARQYGVFDRNEARRLGATPGQIKSRVLSGRWERLHRGVYCMAGCPASWERDLLAACRAAGSAAVVSHRSAAALWALEGFRRGPVELTVPSPSEPDVRRARIHRTRLSIQTTAHRGIPVTTPFQTLVDIAALADEESAEIGLESALRQGLVSVEYTTRRLEAKRGRGRRGTGALADLLVARGDVAPAANGFEVKVVRLLRAHRLPRPERQWKVELPSGPAFIDLGYPPEMVGLELDGYGPHSGREQFHRDRERQNELIELGIYLLRFTHRDYKRRPDWLVAKVLRALNRPR